MSWLSVVSVYGFWKDCPLLGWGALGLEIANTYLGHKDEKTAQKVKEWRLHFLNWAFGNDWDRLPVSYYVWRWNKRHGQVLRLNEKAPLEQNITKMAQRFNALYY